MSKPAQRSAPHPLSVYLGAAMTLPDVEPAAVERMIRGIKKYQAHDYVRKISKLKTAYSEGTSTLSFCPAAGEGNRKSVLLIPSMINGSEILDLLPRRSFTRWLAKQGFDVYLLDWGEPADDPGLQTLDGVVERLAAMARFVSTKAGGPVHAVGYCMGGTLLLGAAARNPDLFSKLVLLSAPWDFHAGDQRMKIQVATGTPIALQLLEAKSLLPVDWIQNVFARVNPALALNKFSSFLDMVDGSTEEKNFIAVEDWLNGGQDMSAGVARSCILDWYGQNKPEKGEWVDLSTLKNHPVLVVAANKDILVPPESAVAAAQQLLSSKIIQPECGHISLMAGKRAEKMVWQPISLWLKKT